MHDGSNRGTRAKATARAQRCAILSREIAEASAKARQAVEESRRLLKRTASPGAMPLTRAIAVAQSRDPLDALAEAVLQARAFADRLQMQNSTLLLEAVLLEVGREIASRPAEAPPILH